MIGIDPEEAAGGTVDEGDLAVLIEHDHAFVERLEDLLEEALFADQPVEKLPGLGRVDPVEAGEEFVEEAGFQKPQERLTAAYFAEATKALKTPSSPRKGRE